MQFDWSDFSALDDSTTAQFDLTERQQQFLLSLLVYAQNRYAWPNISDADWDTADDFMSSIDVILMGGF